MNFGIDFKEPSTTRGLIMIIASIVIGIGWLMGKDVEPIISVAMGLAGGAGFFIKDNSDIFKHLNK